MNERSSALNQQKGDTMAATPPSVKRKIFLKAADIMERRQDELVRAMNEVLEFRQIEVSKISSSEISTVIL